MSGYTAGESEVAEHTSVVSDYNVQITVGVEECWMGELSDVDIVERIARPRLLFKGWICDAAGVFEVQNVAVFVPDKRVHVTIVVDVDECWSGMFSDTDTVEWIAYLRHKDWTRGVAGVFEVQNVTVFVPDKRVHVTIVVDVDECWSSIFSDLDIVERIARPRLLFKGWICDVAGVF